MKVNELSKLTQVTPAAIRHYVRIGLLHPKRNPVNDYQLFSDGDVKRVNFIRQAKGLGFSLNDIQEIFKHGSRGQSPCPTVRKLIDQRIDNNRIRLAELNTLTRRMKEALEKWKNMPDGEPNGDEICHLIETVAEPLSL